MGIGLSPRKGQRTIELDLCRGADDQEEQSDQSSCRDLHGAVEDEGTMSGAGTGVAAGLSSARCSVPAAAAFLFSPGCCMVAGFQGKKMHASF